MANPPVAVEHLFAGEIFECGLLDLPVPDGLCRYKPNRSAIIGAVFVLVPTPVENRSARHAVDLIGLAFVFVVRAGPLAGALLAPASAHPFERRVDPAPSAYALPVTHFSG